MVGGSARRIGCLFMVFAVMMYADCTVELFQKHYLGEFMRVCHF